ncbi:hypothetical protein ACFSQJ_14535 [Croceitalea marina]|uniref:Sulfotransferase domain-containing protein n=1 Tax=Croceitalea marina TaxID=1775166 RepID=A0ABW5N1R7_9FLAO
MTIINRIKYNLLKTSLAIPLKNIQARIQYIRIISFKSDINRKTVYCISPYKTGTTYLAKSFSPKISKHEPLHLASLKCLSNNFDSFFKRRMQYLNLKLECSGFWSAYINELIENEDARDLEYICILRNPSSWVSSVINYWNVRIKMEEYKYPIGNDFFWKMKVGVNLYEFEIGNNTNKNQEIIDKLIQFYMNFTKKTRLLKNLTYVKLEEIDKKLPYIETLLNEPQTPSTQKRFMRKGKHKPFIYNNQSIDLEYELLTAKLIKERELLS